MPKNGYIYIIPRLRLSTATSPQFQFKKVSFPWQFFRCESSPEGKKLDVLFIPLCRTKPGTEGQA